MATYTYDPMMITSGGVDQMRFELGDTIVDMDGISSPLCDEEYNAIISSNPKWKKARLKCLKAIVMKLAYEVNTSTDGLSYSLSDRAKRWKEMYEEEKKETMFGVPTVNPDALEGPPGEPPYFYNDLHTNVYKK